MKGNVIGFDPDTNTGAISGHDGNRYDFITLDWRGPGRPRHGDLVDFQAVDQRATDIFLVEAAYAAPGFGEFYFSAKGRISRSQYWLRFMLPYFAISFGLQLIAEATEEKSLAHGAIGLILFAFSIVALWPSLAILIKRMHDRNRSGWLCLLLYGPLIVFMVLLTIWIATSAAAIAAMVAAGSLAAAPLIGVLGIVVVMSGLVCGAIGLWFFIEFGCLRGTIGSNRYGPDPVR